MSYERKGALEDLLVLDLTRVVSGPFAGSIIGDMGARVIKIEMPKRGDDSRAYGPYVNGESAYFAMLNRSKEGVTLNLKSEEGKAIFLELVKKADVLLENYRPGVMDKLGLGYDVLKDINPRLIYAAVSGFGSYGPYSQRPGYDILAQAMGGLMSLTGPKGGEPVRAGNAMGDMLAGLNMTIGVLAALHSRTLTGKGQRVDVSLLDSIIVSLENSFTRYWHTKKLYVRNGNAYAAIAPYDSFRAKDGLVIIACGNQSLYVKFCTKVLHRQDLIDDPRFIDNVTRVKNMDALKVEIEKWTKLHEVKEIVEKVLAAGVPSGPVYDLGQIVNDKNITEERNLFPIVHHPVIGDMHVNGDVVKLMDTMPYITKPAPTLGEDNYQVYSEMLGLTKEKIDELKTKGVL